MRAFVLRRMSVLAAGVALIGILSCSKNGTGSVDEDDGNSPYVIVDLALVSVSDSSVTLTWTARGDDGDVGTGTQYDLRYYRNPLTTANWDSATQVSGVPAPKPSGETEVYEVRGLKEDSTYYFAVREADEIPNWSGISNSVGATCYNDFEVSFPDPALDSVMREMLGMPTGVIHRSDLSSVTYVDANNAAIASLEGLQYCPMLQLIFMSNNQITSLAPLTELQMLNNVQFIANNITDISPLSASQMMQQLYIGQNSISDISVLADHFALHDLDLHANNISDISPLVTNFALADGDTVYLQMNPLSVKSVDTLIPQLEARGLTVFH
jgi:Leucine-rich repeat (LRR) protein